MAEPSADRRDRNAAVIRSTGTIALVAAFLIVLLEMVSAGTSQAWPTLLAIVLTITGVGLRIEAALTPAGRDHEARRPS
jgi:hypothetical protein